MVFLLSYQGLPKNIKKIINRNAPIKQNIVRIPMPIKVKSLLFSALSIGKVKSIPI